MSNTFVQTKSLGLALGGGGARGIAHIGIIKRLVELGFSIDYISGTSAGAIAGGFYASGMELNQMVDVCKHLTWRNFAKFKIRFTKGLFSSEPIQKLVEKHIGKIKFKDAKIPFTALVTDILSGEGVILNDPELCMSQAIRASSSFPGVFEPVNLNGRYYFDGGATFHIPCSVVKKMGADVVIGVDVIPQVTLKTVPHFMPALIDRGLDCLLNSIHEISYKSGDIILKPVKERVSSFNFKRSAYLIEMGEQVVDDNLDQIKSLLS
ncbi:hypothetical protein DID75_02790 [Candidatus Marinamargulisbacteria bacterium SCGC AG-410-N11]|nr:hypothetical protein DID75_02790 [Candidatus Marinamargulisbacteria bacterium SCGC AG-410-N11]